MSVPMFINSHRIEYSIKLMNEGYLDKFSIMALAEKSGFSSQENFNRVFKLLKKNTPSELKNSINQFTIYKLVNSEWKFHDFKMQNRLFTFEIRNGMKVLK